jgi:hypothetical protein
MSRYMVAVSRSTSVTAEVWLEADSQDDAQARVEKALGEASYVEGLSWDSGDFEHPEVVYVEEVEA